jgi:hypothetical protein
VIPSALTDRLDRALGRARAEFPGEEIAVLLGLEGEPLVMAQAKGMIARMLLEISPGDMDLLAISLLLRNNSAPQGKNFVVTNRREWKWDVETYPEAEGI